MSNKSTRSIVEEKQIIRQEMRRARLAISAGQISIQSQFVQLRVIESEEFNSARFVGAYFSINNEVSTASIIAESIKRGKIIALPRTSDDGLEFFEVTKSDDLVVGKFGISEPGPSAKPVNDLDLILVPALAFDRQGYRVGYGRGYYDKFLKFHKAFSLGLAYDFQVVDSLPHHEDDIRMNAVATIDGILRVLSH